MVSINTTTTSQITSEVKDIDFITKFEKRWQSLVEILGIMRPIKKMAGTKLVSSKATIVMQSGAVEEGEEIPLSQAVIEPIVYKDITLEKYRKRVTAEAVAKYGASVAVAKTDSAFVEELTSGVLDKFYAFLQSGTLTGSESDFQMALAMAVARVKDKFKKMRLDYDNIVVFANTLDVGEYLGGAKITLQNRDGIEYIKDFMGARTIIVSSEIPKGKIIATPADNIVMYYIDPSESQFEELGLEYSTGVSPLKLIGAHREGLFDRASGDIFAILGITLFAEYIDAICVMSIGGAGGGITPFSVGDTIEKGTTYAFDKSKGEEVASLLNGLNYEIDPEVGIGIIDLLGTVTLDTSEREPTLIALSLNGANGLFVIDIDGYVPIYMTEDFYAFEGFINGKKGWNIDGDSYTLLKTSRPSRIQSILETTPAWNGVLVGKGEAEVITPSLTAFKNGDIYKTGTRIIFPKSQMDNLEAFFRDRLANWSYGEDFDMLDENSSSGGLFSLMSVGAFILKTAVADDMTAVLWTSVEFPDMGLTAGFQYQNLVDEGDNYVYTVPEGVSDTVSTENFDGEAYLDQWNGIMIGIDNSQVQ